MNIETEKEIMQFLEMAYSLREKGLIQAGGISMRHIIEIESQMSDQLLWMIYYGIIQTMTERGMLPSNLNTNTGGTEQ